MDALLVDTEADARTWWNAIRAFYHESTALSFVRANYIDVDGTYVAKDRSFRKDFLPEKGTSVGNPLPSEVAFVVTFMTDASRGLASKGRIYCPAPAVIAQGADGRVGTNFATTVRNATAQLVADIGNAPGIDAAAEFRDVSVMSDVREGATRTVTGTRTDNLWDTQRRRGNAYVGIKSAVAPIP
jgi:hypothetical protein